MHMWEKRAVLMPIKPLGLCEDALTDAMATALHAVEAQEGEQRGWDLPARLFTVHPGSLGSRSLELHVVPAQLWNSRGVNPADALIRIAAGLPDVPVGVQRRQYADSPVAGAALMFEAWGRPNDREPTAHEQWAARMGMRVNHLAPDRIEMRCVYGVDINQQQFHLVRDRGEEPRVYFSSEPGSDASGSGRVPDALNRIVHALREGHKVF